jgi:hypothetical protein
LNRVPSLAVFDLHRRSLLRGNLLVLLSFVAAVPMSHFPESRRNPFLAIPTVLAIAGLVFCVYMDLMALSLILFFLLAPYAL